MLSTRIGHSFVRQMHSCRYKSNRAAKISTPGDHVCINVCVCVRIHVQLGIFHNREIATGFFIPDTAIAPKLLDNKDSHLNSMNDYHISLLQFSFRDIRLIVTRNWR